MLHSHITDVILRAFFDVYSELGLGFLESVYEGSLATLLEERGARVLRQAPLDVFFHGRRVGEFRPDLVVNDQVIVELKSVRTPLPVHEAQLINYLRASTIEVGLLLNFGPRPTFRRMVFANARKAVRVGPRSGPPRSSAAYSAEHGPSVANPAEHAPSAEDQGEQRDR